MKKILFSLSTLMALGLTGCGSKDESATDPNTLVSSNFDGMAGWLPDAQNATITREKAHSGVYSIKVDGAHEYSLGFHAPLGQLHETRVKKINVSAWTFVPSADAHASLVVAVTNPENSADKPLLWEGIDLSQDKAYGKWVEIKKTITLPANVMPTSVLGTYVWRSSGDKPVYVDDLRITVEE